MLHDLIVNQILGLCLLKLHVVVSDVGFVLVASIVLLAHNRLQRTNFLSATLYQADLVFNLCKTASEGQAALQASSIQVLASKQKADRVMSQVCVAVVAVVARHKRSESRCLLRIAVTLRQHSQAPQVSGKRSLLQPDPDLKQADSFSINDVLFSKAYG